MSYTGIQDSHPSAIVGMVMSYLDEQVPDRL